MLAAACRFERPDLREEALTLGQAILQHETAEFDGAPMLVAGPWARMNPVTVNPSYFSPATFAALGDVTGDGSWGSLSASSRSVSQALDARRGQPAAGLGEDPGRQAGAERPARPAERNPAVRFRRRADAGAARRGSDPAGREIAAKAWPAFEGRAPADIPVEHDLSGEPVGGEQHPVALVAAAAAADAAGDAGAKAELLDAAEALDRQTPTYYGAAWVALGRVMLETDALDCPWGDSPTASSASAPNAAADGRSSGRFARPRRMRSSRAGARPAAARAPRAARR